MIAKVQFKSWRHLKNMKQYKWITLNFIDSVKTVFSVMFGRFIDSVASGRQLTSRSLHD